MIKIVILKPIRLKGKPVLPGTVLELDKGTAVQFVLAKQATDDPKVIAKSADLKKAYAASQEAKTGKSGSETAAKIEALQLEKAEAEAAEAKAKQEAAEAEAAKAKAEAAKAEAEAKAGDKK